MTALDWSAHDRGRSDCQQDYYENAPFACVGGLAARGDMKRPTWLPEADWPEYRAGYQAAARILFGDDWQTCAFGWSPAITINEPPPPPDECPECGASSADECSPHCPTRGRDGLNPNDDP